MMEESRKQFEEWVANMTNSDLHRAMMLHRRDSGVYGHLATQNKWEAWRASRAAIEIDLPPQVDSSNGQFGAAAWNAYRVYAANSIRAAGLKIKGE